MSTQHSQVTSVKGFELAAGGLVWRCDDIGRKLAIVHRQEHKDWALPKGRPKENEMPEATALREAMEETREGASLEKFAGSYSYFKDDRPKTVLIWHMMNESVDYEHPAPKTEIDQVAWLSPEAAITRLSHQSEREFVSRHCEDRLPQLPDDHAAPEPKRIRLRAAIHSCRLKLQAKVSRFNLDPNTWWVACVLNALGTAETNLKRNDLHGGWGALHDAERFLVFGMTDEELVGSASKLKSETQHKLKSWRGSATDALLAPLNLSQWLKTGEELKEPERTLLRQAIVESLGVLNEHSDNVYHRMDLVEQQLSNLVQVCAGLLILAFLASLAWAGSDSPLRIGFLVSVSLAGALGGVVSAMYQLSRVGESKIPEALLQGKITRGRPLVGAASALFVYWVIQSNLINLIDASKVNLFTALVLGFAAGFSERFVLKIVGKVAGDKDEAPAGKSGRKKKTTAEENDADATDPKPAKRPQAPAKNTKGKPNDAGAEVSNTTNPTAED